MNVITPQDWTRVGLGRSENKKPWIPLHEFLVRETPEVPRTMQAIATALGYPPSLHGETLLLEMPHTLVLGHKEINLKLIRKLLP